MADRPRRERLLTFLLLPVIVLAVLVLAGVMFRSSFQLEKLREQSVVEATLLLANEKADRLDKRIIEHLQEDGRRPFTQIALQLGVSEAAVRARTNRLVERGILQIVGVTDPLKLGFQQMAMVGIRCERDRLVQVAEAVGAFPEVDYVVITAGTYDILIEVVCEDNSALLDFLAEKLRAIDGVRDTETFVYLRMVKQTYQWGTR